MGELDQRILLRYFRVTLLYSNRKYAGKNYKSGNNKYGNLMSNIIKSKPSGKIATTSTNVDNTNTLAAANT